MSIRNWPLRLKLAALLIIVSVLPLTGVAVLDIRDARKELRGRTADLLAARADQVTATIDGFCGAYRRSADRISSLPPVEDHMAGRASVGLLRLLTVWPERDTNIGGIILINTNGVATIATERQIIGRNFSGRDKFREALSGKAVVSDVYISDPEEGSVPTIAFLAPIREKDGRQTGAVGVLVRAKALWDTVKKSDALAGPDSFAVVFDQIGIRIAHTNSDEMIFHPGGKLDSATIADQVRQNRFGERTRTLLEDVQPFPEQFDRARSPAPDTSLFLGLAPVNNQWNFGIARRLTSVRWTLFYMVPEESVTGSIAQMTIIRSILAGVIIFVALAAGLSIAEIVLRPIHSLAAATESLAAGDLTSRAEGNNHDELGRLAHAFNSMAEKIEQQTQALRTVNDNLEAKVAERTAELTRANETLKKSEDRFAAAFRSSPAGMNISKRSDGRFVDANDTFLNLMGYKREEIIGKTSTELGMLSTETRAEIMSFRDRVGLRNFAMPLYTKSGEAKYVIFSSAPIVFDSEEHLISIVIDATEARRAEQALKKSHEQTHTSQKKLAGIIESAMDGIITIDSNHRITLFNAAAERIFGVNSEDVMGSDLNRFIPQRFRDAHPDHVRTFAATNITRRNMGKLGAIFGLRNDGSEFPIEASISQVEVNGEKLFTVILRDISERLEAQKTLRISEERFSTVFHSSPVAKVIARASDRTIMMVNDSFLKVTGFTREEVVGFSGVDLGLVTAEAREELRGLGDHFRDVEVLLGTKNKGMRWISLSTEALDLDVGPCLLSVFFDITDRKNAESSLKESEARIRTILSSLSEGVVFLNKSGVVEMANDAVKKILGRGLEELADPDLDPRSQLVRGNGTPFPVEEQPAIIALQTGYAVHNVEMGVPLADGMIRWISVNADAVRTPSGEVTGAVASFFDVSDQRQARDKIVNLNAELEARVVERTSQLEAANKEMEAFSYSISHDLRSPLRAMSGFSQALIEDYETEIPEGALKFAHTIRDGAARMGHMIDELLSFSRLGRAAIKSEILNMTNLAREMFHGLEAERGTRKIEFNCPDLEPCQGDAELMAHVWTNLISNAVKFTSKKDYARIEIGCSRDENEITYFVRDNGSGFNMKYADKLFEVFQKLHRAEQFAGTGVGLAIVQRIIARHGGRIWADAKENEGATFYFTMPGVQHG